MKIDRTWAMPNKNTFSIGPIRALVRSYLGVSEMSIDPFARDCGWATYTNDMNPKTSAEYHLRAKDFLLEMIGHNLKFDLCLFDPPYSLRQAKEVYEAYGEWKFADTQSVGTWREEKDLIDKLLLPGGVVIHFGWHSNAMGKKRNYTIEQILLVAHGRAHNDTIVTVERKPATDYQLPLIG